MKLLMLFRHSNRHEHVAGMPYSVRRRMNNFLVELARQEGEVAEILNLPTAPQLSVVDEEAVCIIRPRDRAAARRCCATRQERAQADGGQHMDSVHSHR